MEQNNRGERLDNGWYARPMAPVDAPPTPEPVAPAAPAADAVRLVGALIPEETRRAVELPPGGGPGEQSPPPGRVRRWRGPGALAGISVLVSGVLVAGMLAWNPATPPATRSPVPATVTVVVLGAPPPPLPPNPPTATPLALVTARAARSERRAGDQTLITFSGPLTSSVWLAWAPDNRTLALAGNDALVRLLDTTTGQVTFLPGHSGPVFQVAWSPDGQTLASSGADTTVRLWRADGQPQATLTDTRSLAMFAWSPTGALTTMATGVDLVSWQPDGTPFANLRANDTRYSSLAWSPDGQWLAMGTLDKTVRLWNPDDSEERLLIGHTSAVYCLAWSPDSALVAAGADDGSVRIWSRDGALQATLTGHTAFVNSVAWAPDGQTLASAAGDNTVRLWSKAGQPLATLTGPTAAALGVAWSPDGTTLALVAADNTVRLWR